MRLEGSGTLFRALVDRVLHAARKDQVRLCITAVAGLVFAFLAAAAPLSATAAALEGVDAVCQAQAANRERNIAISRYLAAQSALKLEQRYDLALLLAVEANRTVQTSDSLAALLSALANYPRLHCFLHVPRMLRDEFSTSALFGPDRRFMAIHEDQNSVAIWDISERRVSRRFAGPDSWWRLVSLGPGAELIATFGPGIDSVCIWNVETGNKVFSVPYRPWEAGRYLEFHGEFSPDGRLFAARGPNGIVVWDIEQQTQLAAIEADSGGRALAFGPDSDLIAYDDTQRREIVLWDLNKGSELKALPGATGGRWSLAFDYSGEYLAAAGTTVMVWNVRYSSPPNSCRGC